MIQSQKNMKETIWRAKRLTREMQSYWKRYDRVERETRRRLEKEAEEQRKMDVELIEVRKYWVILKNMFLYFHFSEYFYIALISGKTSTKEIKFPYYSNRIICSFHVAKNR